MHMFIFMSHFFQNAATILDSEKCINIMCSLAYLHLLKAKDKENQEIMYAHLIESNDYF